MSTPLTSDPFSSQQRASHTAPAPSGSSRQSDPSKFKLLAELGRGGMATVYLAVWRGPAGFNKLVVVKCLRPSLAAEPEFLEMFLAEARLAARINHPNVVQTNEVGFDGQFYYIVMEYIEGPSLEAIVRRAGPNISPSLHMYILMQALAGLHHAHELKAFDGTPLSVVHRDVSPHNIMVSYDGQVKLLDFGIAKAADSSGNTRTGIMKGKCAYMAAEQFGGHNVDRRADVFAAGVCLWQAVTGARLWKGLSDAEIFSRLSRGEIPSPKTVNPEIPDALEHICMKALALRPEDRYSSAADFLSALDEFVNAYPAYRVSQRDLTKFVTELFAEDRAKVQATVDEQLRHVNQTGSDLVAFAPESPSGLAVQMGEPIPMIGKRRRSLVGLFAIGGVLVLAVGAAGLWKQRNDAASALRTDQTTNTVGAAEAKVSIKVLPESAKIFFDDAPLQGNPASATFTRDGLAHRVRAEADGYARKTELVVLDSSNVQVDLELESISEDEVDPFGNKLTALTVKAAPAGARLYLDETLLPTNPSVAKYPRDGKEHKLKAEALGFLPKTEKVTFDIARKSVSLNLDKDPKFVAAPVAKKPTKGAAGAVHREVPVVAAEPVAAPAPAPTPAPKPAAPAKPATQVIDRGNPWAN